MQYYKIDSETILLLKQLYLKSYFLSTLKPSSFNTYFNDPIKNKHFFGKESLLLSDKVPEIAIEPFKKLNKFLQNIIQLGTKNIPIPDRELVLAREIIYKYQFPLHIDTINELKQKFFEIINSLK